MKYIKFITVFFILTLGIYIPGSNHSQDISKSSDTRTNFKPAFQKSYYSQKHEDADKQPDYAPGEIIIKFKDRSDAGPVAQELLERGQRFESITDEPNLDNLNMRYKATKITRVFKKQKSRKLSVPAGFISMDQAGALRREAKREFLSKVEKIRNKFPAREKRVPGTSRVPFLENIYKVKFEDKAVDIESAVTDYAGDPNIEYAQPNYMNELYMYPDDPYYSSLGSWGQDYDDLWGVKKLDPEPAWDLSQGDGAVVAVIDTGVDYDHEDIRDNIYRDINGNIIGYDFSDSDNDPADYYGHGTHCAGTIAAMGNNSLGIIGVAPMARIMPVKIFPNAYTSVCASGIRFAADNGADVLSNSWGPNARRPSDQVLEDAVDYAYALGCVVVFASGNSNDDVAYYSPANYSKTIAVASTDHNDVKSDFSNYGGLIDVSSPGGDSRDGSPTYIYQNILSLRADGTDMYGDGNNIVGGNYYRARGTSMACPHVSGLAALLISYNPDWPNSMVAGQIKGSTDDVDPVNPGYEGLLGAGRINAYRALTIEPLPNIEYYSNNILDDFPGNTVNGRLDPGETVELVVGLGNYWASAVDVNVNLTTADPLVTVLKSSASYGAIQSGEIKDNDSDRFQLTASEEVPAGHEIVVNLEITAVGYQNSEEFAIVVPITSMPGWPIEITGLEITSPLLADVDDNAGDEIIIGIDNQLLILKADGTNYPFWPQTVADGMMISRHLVGDIDGDGDQEIIAAVNKSAGLQDCYLYAWHHENGSLVQGWPLPLGQKKIIDMALSDLDEAIEDMEIAVVIEDPAAPFKLCLYNGDTSVLNGWPADLPEPYPSSENSRFTSVMIAIGNLDNRGGPEIVVSTQYTVNAVPTYDPSPIFLFHNDGTIVDGWPKTTTGSHPCVVLANLDGGEDIEIIVGSWVEAGNSGRVHAFKYNGDDLNGWPRYDGWSYPTAADIDSDNELEIVSGDSVYLKVLNRSGQLIWSEAFHPYSEPIIGDIDNDGSPDILFSSILGGLMAVDNEGNMKPGFPVDVMDDNITRWPPSLGDLDGDKDMEIVARDEQYLFAYDLPGAKPPAMEWPMWRHDPQFTGLYNPVLVPPTAALNISSTGSGRARVNGSLNDLPWTETFTEGWTVPLQAVPGGGWYFSNWSGNLSGYENPTEVIMDSDKDVTANFMECISLGEALDNSSLVLTTGGNMDWCGQTLIHYYGGDAAASGDVEDDQASWVDATVSGPGSVSFWWKVSSEQGYDFLTFSIDGEPQNAISGEVDWQQLTFIIPDGNHFLTWSYSKDYSVSDGFDCGWLDNILVDTTTPSGTLNLSKTGSGQMRVNGMMKTLPWSGTFALGSEVTLKASADIGWIFSNWSGDIFGSGTPVTITMDDVVDITANFIEGTYTLAESLDNTSLAWTTGGGVQWFGQARDYYYGGSAGESGDIEDSQESWVETTVDGPAVLKFWWKVSSEANYDFLIFSMDGVPYQSISGEVEWQEKIISIPSGRHVLSWLFNKDSIVSEGCDCGWLDKVELIPSAMTYQLSLSGTGNGRVRVSGDLKTLPWSGSFSSGWAGTIEAVPDSGWYFSGWSGALSGKDNPAIITMDADKNAEVNFLEWAYSIGEAVDNTYLTWSTGGDTSWFGQGYTHHYGGDAAESGDIEDIQESWVETVVTGPGDVTFWWKVSSEPDYDFLTFSIDDVSQAAISGEVDWEQRTFSISEGNHTLTWVFDKDVNISEGSDCGWLDNVEVSTPIISHTLNLSGVGSGLVMVDGQPRMLPWSGTFAPDSTVNIEAVPGSGWYFLDWTRDLSGYENPTDITMNSDKSITANFSEWTYSLAEALDNTSLTWATSGGEEWFGQDATAHLDGDAAESGLVNDNQQTRVETVITGPAVLSFWWKVSSEDNYDLLTFSVDDVPEDAISGEVDWQLRTFPIPEGNHALAWTYSKDNNTSRGSDRGWLDNVQTGSSPPLFFDNFSDGTMEGDQDWEELSGIWRVGKGKHLFSNLTRNNKVVVKDLIFSTGRIATKFRMTKRYRKYPNARIIFNYQDGSHYRYIRFKSGKRGQIVIGQVGDFGLDFEGVKAIEKKRLRICKWHDFRLDVHSNGLVEAYLNGAETPVISHTFGGIGSGSLGYRVRRARSKFDNFTVWDDAIFSSP